MKLKNFYMITFMLALFVGLSGLSGGPGKGSSLQVSGAPGSNGNAGTCGNSGCHTAGSFNPTVSMSLFDGANLVAKYEPGKTYTLRIINSPIQGTPAGYGFQAVALNTSNQQAGDWGAPGTGRQVVTINNRKYIEHSTPATNGIFELPWIAPSAGAGQVTFYAASLASNLNGSVSGDGVAKNSLVIAEANISSTSTPEREYTGLKVLPNPVNDILNLQITSRISGNHVVNVLNLDGSVLRTEPVSLKVGLNQFSFPAYDLSPGVYLVHLRGNESNVTVKMLKQ